MIPLSEALDWVISRSLATRSQPNKIMFIGNGGSAGICSHMATDFSKNGGMRSLAFNDGALLTCLGNDYGFEHVFAKQIEYHARAGDLLVAISSSGRSADILNGVAAARKVGCAVVTFSGFSSGNPLRSLGDMNFFVASDQYGFVEVAHQALIHAWLDIALGWSGSDSIAP
ncbi:MAG: SIS domain-containing protein [Alphaproteobacteria bacterium]|nr:SIS domain-containing protein [Alphaproteobacteria bacterium]